MRLAPPALLLALTTAACLPSAGLSPVPPYRQGLIDPDWDPLAPPLTSRPPPDTRARALARCRRWIGRTLAASPGPAEEKLLQVCLGRVPADRDSPSRDHTPRPLDIAVFDLARTAPGQPPGRLRAIVLTVGDRVEFLYARGNRARLGVLSLERPERRRSGDRLENTYLRVIQRDDPAGARYLAGQLLVGFLPSPL